MAELCGARSRAVATRGRHSRRGGPAEATHVAVTPSHAADTTLPVDGPVNVQ